MFAVRFLKSVSFVIVAIAQMAVVLSANLKMECFMVFNITNVISFYNIYFSYDSFKCKKLKFF